MAKKNTNASKKEEKAEAVHKEESGSKSQSLIMAILVLAVIQLLLTGGLYFALAGSSNAKIDSINEKVTAMDEFFSTYADGYNSAGGSAAGGSNTGGTSMPSDITVDIEGEPVKGSADAPITIVEFSDYECPFCGRFFSEVYPRLNQHIEDGSARLVYKDFPLTFHPMAEPAAVAAQCVYEQAGNEAYFEYHDTIFTNQARLSVDNLRVWASDMGLDMAAWDECVQDPATTQEVQGDLQEGAAIGVSGTPSFVINGKLIVGACPYETFQQAIEKELAGEEWSANDRCQIIS